MSSNDQTPAPSPCLGITFEHNVRLIDRDMVNGRLISAARALLGWDQTALAGKAGIRRQTLAELEAEVRRPQARVRNSVLGTLEEAGVRFVEIDGARGPVLSARPVTTEVSN